jgi:hypothetical protein
VSKAKEGIKEVDDLDMDTARKEQRRSIAARNLQGEAVVRRDALPQREPDADANAGSDYDASDLPVDSPEPVLEAKLTAPNSVFEPARIMVNPRCVTTYAGVSHTQLALDLFGPPDRDEERRVRQDVLMDWESAPDTFVCQEQQ